MTTQAISTRSILRDIPFLPDFARVRLPVVAALLAVGPRTVQRLVDAGEIPQPIKQGGVLTWRVGDLRSALGSDYPAKG